MFETQLPAARRHTAGVRSPLRVERMENRNGPSSLLDPLFALFDWGAAATAEWIDAAVESDVWEPVYVGESPGAGGADGESNPVAQGPGGGGQGLPNQKPQVTLFTYIAGSDGYYTFQGTVVDENPAGLTVKLGNLQGLMNQTAVTDADGKFSITVRLSPGDRGTATAITTDSQGLPSDLQEATVF